MQSKSIKVINIIGNIRSGSTVLNILLGVHPDIIAAGEIRQVTRGKLHDLQCSCGQTGDSCEFWREVLEYWEGKNYVDNVEKYRKLQWQFERYRNLPLKLLGAKYKTGKFTTYAQATRGIYEALAHVGQAPTISDSSKHPARAVLMSQMADLDMRYIFLVRDVRGYVASRKRMQKGPRTTPLPVWKSAFTWVWANLVCEDFIRRVPNGIMIRYEDLLIRPRHTLQRIGVCIDKDLTEIAAAIEAGEGLRIGHLLAGNRLRKQSDLHVKRTPETWDPYITPKEAQIAWRIAGRMMRRYGYSKEVDNLLS